MIVDGGRLLRPGGRRRRFGGFLVVAALAVAVGVGGCGGVATKPVTPAGSAEVTFASGGDTLHGTFQRPASDHAVPAALIISGSGPTDRNGNDPQFPHLDTNRNFATALAGDGVASLRYDKVGSGATGLATHIGGAGIDFNMYAAEVLAAYQTLAHRPGVDPRRLIVVGHSEGSLFALWLADHLAGTPQAPAALVLAAPAGRRYLDVLRSQLTGQYQQAQVAGRLSPPAASARIAALDNALDTLRATGVAPTGLADPTVAALLSPANAAFLFQADRQDPAELAGRLPAGTRVLMLRGLKDQQVTGEDVDRLMAAMTPGHRDVERADLPDSDHLFKIVPGVPNPAVDYANANRPFDPAAIAALKRFLARI